MNHTPGPWNIQQSDDPNAGLLIKPIPGDVVAECDPLPEMAANARLLAAAPDLYSALLAVMRYWAEDTEEECFMPASIYDAAHNALKKAEGVTE